jgi:inhibitor of cysteine peptidase
MIRNVFNLVKAIIMTTQLFDESFNGQTIDLSIGQSIEIRLQENPTTGFRWQLMSGDRAVCAMTSDTFEQKLGSPGRGGEHSWIFEAVSPGECTVEFRYQRPWIDPAQPGRMFQLYIHVEKSGTGVERGH